jgi:hypothetical protein
LVEEKAGFLAFLEVDAEGEPVFADGPGGFAGVGGQEPVFQHHLFAEAGVVLVFEVHVPDAQRLQAADQVRVNVFGALDEQLQHGHVVVHVGNDPGKEVALRVQQAVRIGSFTDHKLPAQGVRLPHLLVPVVGPRKVDFFAGEGKHPAHDLAVGGEKAVAQQALVVVVHGHDVAVLGVGQIFDGPGKQPGVTVVHRPVAAGFEGQTLVHARKSRKKCPNAPSPERVPVVAAGLLFAAFVHLCFRVIAEGFWAVPRRSRSPWRLRWRRR